MPKQLERKLARSAKKRHLKKGTPRWLAYVYGTLARIKRRSKRRV